MEWIFTLSIFIFSALCLYAAISDWNNFKIPNWVSMALIAFWPIHLWAKPEINGWYLSLAVAVVILLAGMWAFNRNYIGAGDVKFLSSTTLWVPPALIGDYLMVIAISGGVLCAALLAWRYASKKRAETVAQTSQSGAIAQHSPYFKQYAPYGIAIAIGGLYAACKLLINTNTLG